MGYEKQTWVNGAEGGTPLSAPRLNHLEAGVDAAADVADDAKATADAALPKAGGIVTGELVAQGGVRDDQLQAGENAAVATVTGGTYTSLVSPTVDVEVGTSGRLKVTVALEARMSVGTGAARAGVALSGATARAASDPKTVRISDANWRTGQRTVVFDGLIAGTHTVTVDAKVDTAGDEAEVRYLQLIAEPI